MAFNGSNVIKCDQIVTITSANGNMSEIHSNDGIMKLFQKVGRSLRKLAGNPKQILDVCKIEITEAIEQLTTTLKPLKHRPDTWQLDTIIRFLKQYKTLCDRATLYNKQSSKLQPSEQKKYTTWLTQQLQSGSAGSGSIQDQCQHRFKAIQASIESTYQALDNKAIAIQTQIESATTLTTLRMAVKQATALANKLDQQRKHDANIKTHLDGFTPMSQEHLKILPHPNIEAKASIYYNLKQANEKCIKSGNERLRSPELAINEFKEIMASGVLKDTQHADSETHPEMTIQQAIPFLEDFEQKQTKLLRVNHFAMQQGAEYSKVFNQRVHECIDTIDSEAYTTRLAGINALLEQKLADAKSTTDTLIARVNISAIISGATQSSAQDETHLHKAILRHSKKLNAEQALLEKIRSKLWSCKEKHTQLQALLPCEFPKVMHYVTQSKVYAALMDETRRINDIITSAACLSEPAAKNTSQSNADIIKAQLALLKKIRGQAASALSTSNGPKFKDDAYHRSIAILRMCIKNHKMILADATIKNGAIKNSMAACLQTLIRHQKEVTLQTVADRCTIPDTCLTNDALNDIHSLTEQDRTPHVESTEQLIAAIRQLRDHINCLDEHRKKSILRKVMLYHTKCRADADTDISLFETALRYKINASSPGWLKMTKQRIIRNYAANAVIQNKWELPVQVQSIHHDDRSILIACITAHLDTFNLSNITDNYVKIPEIIQRLEALEYTHIKTINVKLEAILSKMMATKPVNWKLACTIADSVPKMSLHQHLLSQLTTSHAQEVIEKLTPSRYEHFNHLMRLLSEHGHDNSAAHEPRLLLENGLLKTLDHVFIGSEEERENAIQLLTPLADSEIQSLLSTKAQSRICFSLQVKSKIREQQDAVDVIATCAAELKPLSVQKDIQELQKYRADQKISHDVYSHALLRLQARYITKVESLRGIQHLNTHDRIKLVELRDTGEQLDQACGAITKTPTTPADFGFTACYPAVTALHDSWVEHDKSLIEQYTTSELTADNLHNISRMAIFLTDVCHQTQSTNKEEALLNSLTKQYITNCQERLMRGSPSISTGDDETQKLKALNAAIDKDIQERATIIAGLPKGENFQQDRLKEINDQKKVQIFNKESTNSLTRLERECQALTKNHYKTIMTKSTMCLLRMKAYAKYTCHNKDAQILSDHAQTAFKAIRKALKKTTSKCLEDCFKERIQSCNTLNELAKHIESMPFSSYSGLDTLFNKSMLLPAQKRALNLLSTQCSSAIINHIKATPKTLEIIIKLRNHYLEKLKICNMQFPNAMSTVKREEELSSNKAQHDAFRKHFNGQITATKETILTQSTNRIRNLFKRETAELQTLEALSLKAETSKEKDLYDERLLQIATDRAKQIIKHDLGTLLSSDEAVHLSSITTYASTSVQPYLDEIGLNLTHWQSTAGDYVCKLLNDQVVATNHSTTNEHPNLRPLIHLQHDLVEHTRQLDIDTAAQQESKSETASIIPTLPAIEKFYDISCHSIADLNPGILTRDPRLTAQRVESQPTATLAEQTAGFTLQFEAYLTDHHGIETNTDGTIKTYRLHETYGDSKDLPDQISSFVAAECFTYVLSCLAKNKLSEDKEQLLKKAQLVGQANYSAQDLAKDHTCFQENARNKVMDLSNQSPLTQIKPDHYTIDAHAIVTDILCKATDSRTFFLFDDTRDSNLPEINKTLIDAQCNSVMCQIAGLANLKSTSEITLRLIKGFFSDTPWRMDLTGQDIEGRVNTIMVEEAITGCNIYQDTQKYIVSKCHEFEEAILKRVNHSIQNQFKTLCQNPLMNIDINSILFRENILNTDNSQPNQNTLESLILGAKAGIDHSRLNIEAQACRTNYAHALFSISQHCNNSRGCISSFLHWAFLERNTTPRQNRRSDQLQSTYKKQLQQAIIHSIARGIVWPLALLVDLATGNSTRRNGTNQPLAGNKCSLFAVPAIISTVIWSGCILLTAAAFTIHTMAFMAPLVLVAPTFLIIASFMAAITMAATNPAQFSGQLPAIESLDSEQSTGGPGNG